MCLWIKVKGELGKSRGTSCGIFHLVLDFCLCRYLSESELSIIYISILSEQSYAGIQADISMRIVLFK